MKVGDLVKQVCPWSKKKMRGSTSVVIEVRGPVMDIVILNNDCSGSPQRLGHVYQEDYVVARECA